MAEKKTTTGAKQTRNPTPRNIERIWQKEMCGKQPFTVESFRQIADWAYDRLSEEDRLRVAVDLMGYAHRGTTAHPG